LAGALPAGSTLYYSVKANPNIAIIQVLASLGASFEVASGGELRYVEAAGVPASKAIFLGPAKRRAEIAYAIERSVSLIVAESATEVATIRAESRLRETRTPVALRINPGQGRGKLSMGGETQFGMAPAQASELCRQYAGDPHLEIVGVHGYLAARVLGWQDIVKHSRLILDASSEIAREASFEVCFAPRGERT
jgi:diaminopimelate decarboxylase